MKRLIGVVVAAALLVGWWRQPALAGTSAAHLRWEGAAIALGTVGLIAALAGAAEARPVAVSVGAGGCDPGCVEPRYCSPAAPPPPPPPVWVPGHWEEVEVWVPAIVVASQWPGSGCCDDDCRHWGRGGRHRHGHERCRPDRHRPRETRGHFERRRVWKDGCYR